MKLNARTPSQLSLLVTSLLTCCSYMLGTYTLYRVTYILYWVSMYTLYWVFTIILYWVSIYILY